MQTIISKTNSLAKKDSFVFLTSDLKNLDPKYFSGEELKYIKSGFGFGARTNLGFLVFRYDMAWRTNFNSVEPHTKHYFSLGADF